MTSRRETGHLLRRAGLGARPAEFDAFAPLSWQAAVARVLDYYRVPDTLPAEPTPTRTRPDSDELMLASRDVMTWWYERLVRSERPLEERMTLFWHDHFATALSKVPAPLMAGTIETLRGLALGNYRDMLRAVATDPGMLVYLDGTTNVKGQANENYARELFELHTLGEGNYSETDVKETARALTGWVALPRFSASVFARRRHDGGIKRIFGQTGAFDLEGVLDLVLDQPSAPDFIAGKLAAALIGPGLSGGFVRALADRLVDADFEVRPVVEAILLSDEFREGGYRAQIKSPVDFAVGAVRNLGAEADPLALVGVAAEMGQMLLNPPDPSGYAVGMAWVNGNTALLRSNYANLLVVGRERRHEGRRLVRFSPDDLLAASGADDAESTVQTFVDLLYDGEIDFHDRAVLLDYLGPDFQLTAHSIDGKVRGLIYLLLSSPTYALL